VVILHDYQAARGDFTMLSRCTIPLVGLLKSKPLIRLNNHPMLSISSGDIIANVNVECRLAIPVSELYRLFLERHPLERRQIEDLGTRRVLEAAGDVEHAKNIETVAVASTAEDEARLYNELEVAIIKAIGLPESADHSPPTAYVHFQLLGNPDQFTNPIPNSSDPDFNERFTFPMITNDQQLRLIQRSKLLVTVIDLKGEELNDNMNGLIGEASISMFDIGEGMSIMDIYSLKDRDGNKNGEIQLSLRWKLPFRRQRELGPRSLSGVEVELLISAFSAGDENEGNVLRSL
jgi:hypothetical protein